MDELGVADASTDNERLAAAAIRGGTAGAGSGGVGLAKIALGGLSGAISGASGEETRQEGFGPAGQTVASLAGGIAPFAAAGAVKASLGTIARGLPGANPAPRAAMQLNEAAFNPAAALENIRKRPLPSPETAPTLAEVAKDPGLAAFQRSKRTTAIQEQQRNNALARAETADSTMGPGNPQALQETAQTQGAQAADAVTAGREAIGPQADRMDSGAAVREQFGNQRKVSAAGVDEAYTAHRASITDDPITLSNVFHDEVEGALKPFYGDGTAPMSGELQTIVDDLRKPDATGARFGNIDRRLAEFSANIRRQGGSNTEAGAADSLRNVIDAHAAEILPPEQIASLREAKALRAQHGETFEQGNAAEAMATKQYGEPVKDNVELPPALVKGGPGGAATADRLTAAVGPKATEATVRAELRRVADEGQVQTGKQVQALVKKYGETLQRFPALWRDIDRLHDHAALNEAFLKGPLGKMAEGDPSAALAKVLLNPDDGGAGMAQLIEQIKDQPAAMSGLRRSMAEFISAMGKGEAVTAEGINIPNPARSAQAIDMVLQRGGKALSSQQRIVLQQLKREMDSVSYAEKAGVVKGAEAELNPLELIGAVSANANMLKRAFAWATNEKAVDALIEQALLDPSIAADLLAKPTPARLSRLKTLLKTVSRGAAAGSLQNGQPQ